MSYREAGRRVNLCRYYDWRGVNIKPVSYSFQPKGNRRNRCGWFANLNVIEYHNSKRTNA